MAEFESWEDLVKALRNGDSDLETWNKASKAFTELAKPEHIPELYELLAESDYIFPGELVAVHLARLEGVKALPALVKRFSEAPNPQDADGLQNVIYKLLITYPDEALPYLLSLADSSDTKIHENVVWMLNVVKPRLDAKLAEKLARDEDAAVRAATLPAIAHFKGQDWAFDTLVKALDDSDRNVRVWAVLSLGNFNDQRAVGLLSKYTRGSDLYNVAQASIKKLQESGEN